MSSLDLQAAIAQAVTTLTPEQIKEVARMAVSARSDLERRLAASVLLAVTLRLMSQVKKEQP